MPRYIQSKTILSRHRGAPDPYFGITFSMNLYRGCQHQCIYCDSRSKVYGLGNLADIRIKRNALVLLDKELASKRTKATIGTGSMNDPYMPAEKNEELVRGALKLILKHRFPVHVLTKSDLVVRDSDILKEIAGLYAAVSFTITTPSDALSNIIEPGAVASSLRFKAMQALAAKGIYTGVILTPVLPFITDNEEQLRELIVKAADSGASYIIAWMGMTQREGQREYFYEKLDRHFPGLRQKYSRAFGNNYQCPSPGAVRLYNTLSEVCMKINLPLRMNFFEEKAPSQLSLF
jgi:DNA repair photolyase